MTQDETKSLTLEEAVEHVATLFDDGFQWHDLWDAIPKVMELVGSMGTLSNGQKKEHVLKIIDKLLDKIDLPGPDWLTKMAIMWILPGAIDKLCDAANGKFNF